MFEYFKRKSVRKMTLTKSLDRGNVLGPQTSPQSNHIYVVDLSPWQLPKKEGMPIAAEFLSQTREWKYFCL